WEDGEIEIEDGRIASFGQFDGAQQADTVIVDHRPNLIVPGFIDPHIHFPQAQVLGTWAANLLEWLEKHTFVAEQKFAEAEHAARLAPLFIDELIRHGTTTAAVY